MANLGRGRLYPPIGFDDARRYGLDEVEWERIVDRMGRNPNDMEAAIFAMLWSEAYCNKSSASLLDTIAREDSRVVKIPGCRVKLIPIGDNEYVAIRVISNNHQSYVDSYYGVQTAMDMALTEMSTVGATPLAILNLFRFGNSEQIANQRLFQNAAAGVSAYSNRFGLPVIGGDLYFHQQYNYGTIVNSAAVGVVTTDHPLERQRPAVGSPILYVGAKTGRDGLVKEAKDDYGLFAEKRRVGRTIKMSDPLLANRLIAACVEAMHAGVLRDLVSASVGGLGTACFDLASRIGNPISLDIDRIPRKVENMSPKEILLSESSERLLVLATKGEHRKLVDIFHKWDIDSLMVGQVIDADGIEFYWNHYMAADIPFSFAMGGSIQKHYEVVKFPPMLRRTDNLGEDADAIRRRKRKIQDEWTVVRDVAEKKQELAITIDRATNLEDTWLDLLANPNLCSRRPIYRLCDQVVGLNAVVRNGGDAGLLRLKEDGIKRFRREDGTRPKKGIAVTLDANSLYVGMEPYLGTVQTIAEAMRNLAAVGARPLGVAYSFNFGDPGRYKEVCDLSEAIRGLGDATKIWNIPILSEHINLYNGTEGNPTLPTPAILMAGLVNDVNRTSSVPFKDRGDRILLIGKTQNEIGCSEYGWFSHHQINRLVPDVNFELEKQTCECVIQLIEAGLLRSAHDLSSGGLALAFTESCLAGERPIGATLSIEDTLDAKDFRSDVMLFSETGARFLVSCLPEDEEKVRELLAEHKVPVTGEGTVGGRDIVVEGCVEVTIPLSTAYKVWSRRLALLLGQSDQSKAAA